MTNSSLYKKAFLFFFVLLFADHFSFSQNYSGIQTVDSLKLKFAKDSVHLYRYQKIRPVLRIDNRDSYIKNKFGTKSVPLYVNGIQFDLIYKSRHTFGICGYTITNSSKQRKLTDNDQTVRYQNMNLAYMTLYYQYSIISRRFIEVDFPFEMGLGKYDYHLSDADKNNIVSSNESHFMEVAGAGAKIVLKPLKWIGFSISGGYRLTFIEKASDMNMNSFYTSYGIWVDLRQIYRDSRFYFSMRPKYRKQLKQLRYSGKSHF